MELAGEDETGRVFELAERKLAAGDADWVARLGIAVARERTSSGDHLWQYRSVGDYVLRLLTLAPGRDNVEQALRLIATASPADRRRQRYAASLLAAGQSPADLVVAFAGGASSGGAPEELRACLVHELVLRGTAIAEMRSIARRATSAHWQYHPLAWLPLELSGLEAARSLPSYHARGGSYAAPYGPSSQEGRPLPDVRGKAVPSARDVTTPVVSAAIGAAVANWVEESNGKVEAKVFDLVSPLRAELMPGALAALSLDCLCGLTPRSRLTLSACPSTRAWQVLFAAASSGGACNHGLYGAYGRLAAWQSIAGLCGANADAPAAEVERQAQVCDWFSFDADTGWFEQVAWDIGLAALWPRRRSLAILAATDTD